MIQVVIMFLQMLPSPYNLGLPSYLRSEHVFCGQIVKLPFIPDASRAAAANVLSGLNELIYYILLQQLVSSWE